MSFLYGILFAVGILILAKLLAKIIFYKLLYIYLEDRTNYAVRSFLNERVANLQELANTYDSLRLETDNKRVIKKTMREIIGEK